MTPAFAWVATTRAQVRSIPGHCLRIRVVVWPTVTLPPGRPRTRDPLLTGRFAQRVGRFLRGYASVVRVSPDEASVIPLYVRGRGLQMIAKRVRAGRNHIFMLAQVQWLTANDGEVGDALVAALP